MSRNLWLMRTEIESEIQFRENEIAWRAQEALRLRKESNLGRRFESRTFETFDRSKAPDAYDVCYEYAHDTKSLEQGNSLLMYGKVGTGKTHLAAAIANYLVDTGTSVLFDTYTNHLNKLKAEFTTQGNGTYLEKLKSVPLLVLDDVGKEKQTEWSRAVMFDVINCRYERMLPIVITTNYDSKGLEEYFDEAVFSRLCEMCSAITIDADDYRRTVAE